MISGRRRGRHARTEFAVRSAGLVVVIVAAAAFSGCGGAGGGSGPLTVGVYQPFEGSEAAYGPTVFASCAAAATEVNTGGGVLGHQLKCKPYDSSSDPADALPLANRMLATASNLAFVLGPDDVEPAVEPVLNQGKVVHFALSGMPRYDHQTSPWYFRPYPSDSLAGVAEAIYLIQHGYKHAAAVFSNDASSQNQVPNLVSTYQKLGGQWATKLTLVPGQTYRTEVARLASAKPDAIITELDPQSSAAFFTELAQFTNHIPPIVSTVAVTTEPNWIKSVQAAIGKQAAEQIRVITPGGPNGPGYSALEAALLHAPDKIANRRQYLNFLPVNEFADGVIGGALAMQAAKSTDPSKWGRYVTRIANGGPGAVTVHSYAQGFKELKAGHQVHYVGAAGEMPFDQYHNIAAPFQAFKYTGPKAGWVPVPNYTISAAAIAKYMS